MLMPWALSNALITIAATVLATELHARYTFRTGRRAGWRRHWQSAGSAAAAYAATSVAVFALHALQPSPSTLTEQLVYLSASGLAGTGRFLILRLFVFATGRDQGTKTRNTTQTTTILTSPPLATPRAPGVATATATVMAGTSIPCTTIPRPRRTSAHCTGLAAALSPSRRQQPPTASRRPTGRPPVSSEAGALPAGPGPERNALHRSRGHTTTVTGRSADGGRMVVPEQNFPLALEAVGQFPTPGTAVGQRLVARRTAISRQSCAVAGGLVHVQGAEHVDRHEVVAGQRAFSSRSHNRRPARAPEIGSHIEQPCVSADTLTSATIRCRQGRRHAP
ncbi:hypothetical protein AB0D91_40035 [Streptomyces canus]|uniref:hypothetical protein n=1 Tax=Streptomyces canus TaxID=58343 RepID=UPI003410D26B